MNAAGARCGRPTPAGRRIAVLPATRPALGIDTPDDDRRFVERIRAGREA